ncbi:hypothetical protein G4B88_011089 [Cannabis sativa]|uniref:Brix domain-containing protein n=1 Tax=Cannabis sativa TaxID=3483 RepID=A0A7J6DNL5_CANSA|nr:hypothetical protein G4B88_011089 [Cannabis sativa]
MLRRNIRLRREYLYRKSLEGKARILYEKKLKIKEIQEEGKQVPTELRNEEAALRHEIDLEDESTAGMVLVIVLLFEKKLAGIFSHTEVLQVFKYVVPYSAHIPSYADTWGWVMASDKPFVLNADELDIRIEQKIKGENRYFDGKTFTSASTLSKAELSLVFPNSLRTNRGGQVISEMIESCRRRDFTDVILVHEHRGVPDGLIISHLPYGPTAYFQLLNVVGERAANILKHLFPSPKPETKRIITFANESDYISFRHHIYERQAGPKSVELKEIGPRFELRLFQIKLGTVDQSEAEIEWVIRPYMNTSKKRKFLGD